MIIAVNLLYPPESWLESQQQPTVGFGDRPFQSTNVKKTLPIGWCNAPKRVEKPSVVLEIWQLNRLTEHFSWLTQHFSYFSFFVLEILHLDIFPSQLRSLGVPTLRQGPDVWVALSATRNSQLWKETRTGETKKDMLRCLKTSAVDTLRKNPNLTTLPTLTWVSLRVMKSSSHPVQQYLLQIIQVRISQIRWFRFIVFPRMLR